MGILLFVIQVSHASTKYCCKSPGVLFTFAQDFRRERIFFRKSG
nr:MAG TPA_asm: hypothetical protein [Caudoviricetes sp.]